MGAHSGSQGVLTRLQSMPAAASEEFAHVRKPLRKQLTYQAAPRGVDLHTCFLGSWLAGVWRNLIAATCDANIQGMCEGMCVNGRRMGTACAG